MPYLETDYLKNIEALTEALESSVFTNLFPLEAVCRVSREPIAFSQRNDGAYKKLSIGEKWGELFDCAWFHVTGRLPEGKYRDPVVLIDISGEGLVVDRSGNPVRGLTSKNSNYPPENGVPVKRVIPISEALDENGNIDITIDASANDLLGIMRGEAVLQTCHIAEYHRDRETLLYDIRVLSDLLSCLDEKSARYRKILFTLYDIAVSLDSFSEEKIREARERAASLYTSGGESALRFTAIGHSHIDLAWLWPIRETRRKGLRTFVNAIKNMEKYPGYIFGASQPQLYRWVKEDSPALYEKVREKIAEGRWELQGCMWVEADTNLPSGESLVRQILYGKRFFKEEFGCEIDTLWLPDAFGYSGALPQLLKKSGCRYFMTQKLSWNRYNRMPHQTFTWKGIDGSEVFAHMLPEETYNSTLLPHQIHFAEHNYRDAGIADTALILFGIGDGGGGPGWNHLEIAERITDLNGICPVTQGFAAPALAELERQTRGKRKTWCGELYLEKHHGTYTTQAKNKYYNRKAELALKELSFAAAVTEWENGEREEYEQIWKEILLYQFHDILPGSSIKRVYDESVARYEILLPRIEAMTRRHYEKLTAGNGMTAFNPLSFARREIIRRNGRYYAVNLPPLGYGTYICAYRGGDAVHREGVLENCRLRAVFDSDGFLVSLADKRNGREYIGGRSGMLTLYTDIGGDCWDIAKSYRDRPAQVLMPDKTEYGSDGVTAFCRQHFTFGSSSAELLVSLMSDDGRLIFRLDVDWHEKNRMLRTAFDTAVFSDYASFEMQFGYVRRAVHCNTSWNEAQYEVCAHKYVDLSETDHGVSLFNDCKYGFYVKNGIIDMNILRSQSYPGTDADEGTHTVLYALYPHEGGLKEARVPEEAARFNMPVTLLGRAGKPFCFANADGVIIDTLKPAEDGRGLIMRAYEPYGCHTKAKIVLHKAYEVTETDLTENDISPIGESDIIASEFHPFEIRTYRLTVTENKSEPVP